MKHLSSLALAALFCAASGGTPLQAQSAPDTGITRQQADDILNELRGIRLLLERQADGPAKGKDGDRTAKLSLAGTPMLGSADAPLTVVEFTDYQCQFCQSFHVSTFPELKKNFIDTGKVRFYSRDMPLEQIHGNAMRAAIAGRCANEQGQFWKLRELMSKNPQSLDLTSILAFAAGLKMDTKALRTCIETEKYKEAVQTDVMEGLKVGAEGTPTFIVGKSTATGVDGVLVVGALPYSDFALKLKQAEAIR
jgi:protein-disulfide isomerase